MSGWPIDLDELIARDAEDSLHRTLGATSELIAEISERDEATPLDPALVAALVAAADAPDAPFTVESIRRRIESGTLTWERFWSAPLAEPGGPWLMARAMRTQLEAARSFLAERPDVDETTLDLDAPRSGGAGYR